MVTTESGLQYKDIKVGGGPSPPIGFQVRTVAYLYVRELQLIAVATNGLVAIHRLFPCMIDRNCQMDVGQNESLC